MDRLFVFLPPKKWYWPFIINVITVSVVSACWLHCAVVETPKSHLELQLENAIFLLKISNGSM